MWKVTLNPLPCLPGLTREKKQTWNCTPGQGVGGFLVARFFFTFLLQKKKIQGNAYCSTSFSVFGKGESGSNWPQGPTLLPTTLLPAHPPATPGAEGSQWPRSSTEVMRVLVTASCDNFVTKLA